MCYSCQWFCQISIMFNDAQERVIFTPKKGTNIYKRKDGRWEARYLKSINQDGKRIYGSVYGKTFDEAKRKQEEVIQNHSQVTKKNSRVVLKLQEISSEWRDSIRQTVKESTYLKYENIIRKHILSHDISTINKQSKSIVYRQFVFVLLRKSIYSVPYLNKHDFFYRLATIQQSKIIECNILFVSLCNSIGFCEFDGGSE